MNERKGYSWLNVRSVNEDLRIIEGIATTPAVARDGDVVVPEGIQFKLPIPFLWRHKDPFGNVIAADVSSEGIRVRIQVGASGISAAIDEQWAMIKAGLVRGLSIGFRILEESFSKEIGGFRILKSEWLELSAVPVPADAGAMITAVRSADELDLAALGRKEVRSASRLHHTPPGASGSPRKRGDKMKSFEDRIQELEQERAPIQARMKTVMETRAADGSELSDEEKTAFDADTAEIERIDTDLKRFRAYQQAVGTAVPVSRAVANGERQPAAPLVQRVESQLPKGTGMARYVIAFIRAKGNHFEAATLAQRFYKDTPEVALSLRAAVEVGDTTTSGWASQLIPAAQQMQSEFLDLLRPQTIIGRIPGLRTVPFNVAVPLQTGGGTYGWVGEKKRKPATAAAFDRVTLRWAKAAGIIVITDELARFSSPAAEAIIRNEMIQGCARFLDTQFVHSGVAAVSNVSPASITNGISPKTVNGATAADFRYDMNQLIGAFLANNQDPSTAVFLMSAAVALGASSFVNALGQPEFPGLTMQGGNYMGIPVIVSANVKDASGDSIILVNASDILFADDGGMRIDMSNQASVEMSSTPTNPEDSPLDIGMRSLWQENLIGLRVERYITWLRARSSAVEWLDNAAYGPVAP